MSSHQENIYNYYTATVYTNVHSANIIEPLMKLNERICKEQKKSRGQLDLSTARAQIMRRRMSIAKFQSFLFENEASGVILYIIKLIAFINVDLCFYLLCLVVEALPVALDFALLT